MPSSSPRLSLRGLATAAARRRRCRGAARHRTGTLAAYLEQLESRSMMALSPGMTLVGTTAPPWNWHYGIDNKPAVSNVGFLPGMYAEPGNNPQVALDKGGNLNVPFTVNGSPAFSQPVQTSDWWSNLMLRHDPQQVSNSYGTFPFQYANAWFYSDPTALKFRNHPALAAGQPWVQGLGILNQGSFGIDPDDVGPNFSSLREVWGVSAPPPLTVGIGGNVKTNSDTRQQEISPLSTAFPNTSAANPEGQLNVRVNSYSDWGVQVVYGDGNPDNPVDRKNALTIDMLNGSPFTYFTKSSASADTNAFGKVWLTGTAVPGRAPALPINQVWGRPQNLSSPGPDELPANVLGLTLTTNGFDPSGVLRANTTSYLVIAKSNDGTDDSWSFRNENSNPVPDPTQNQVWTTPMANGTIAVVSLPHQIGQTTFEGLSDADKVAVAKLFLDRATPPVAGPTATQVSDPKPHVKTYNNETILFGADIATGFVNTRHTVSIQGDKPTLQVLYPHQYKNLFASDRKNFATFTPTSGPDAGKPVRLTYNTPLGPARLYAGSEFATQTRFQGLLNDLPNVAVQTDRLAAEAIYSALEAFMTRYLPNPDFAIPALGDTYATGTGMMKLSRTLQVADSLAAPTSLLTTEQQARATAWRDRLLQDLRAQLLSWFDPATGRFFQLNTTYDTVIGYPAGFGSDFSVNDHHFHYGYFLAAFATIGQFNPGLLQSMNSQIRLLIRDIANFDRADKQLPFLREFNPWAGHSWADGLGRAGNNQESASEAVNAYASIIRLGMLMNDQSLVAQGVYLYQSEVEAMKQYWLNTSADAAAGNFGNYSQEFAQYLVNGQPVNVTQASNVKQNNLKRDLFFKGGNPAEAAYSINWLPTAAWMLFLGNDQDYLKRNWAQYVSDVAATSGGGLPEVYQEVVAGYQALMADDGFGLDKPGARNALLRLDPDRNRFVAATNQTDPGFDSYAGTNQAIALDWVYGMKHLGQVDPTVVADTTSYGVFIKDGQRTYTAFNPAVSGSAVTVTFRDAVSGVVLQTLRVEPGQTVTRLPDGRLLIDVSMQSRTSAGTSLFLRKPDGQAPDAPANLTLSKSPGSAVPIQVIAENPSQKLLLDAYASTYTTVPKRPGNNNQNIPPADPSGIEAFTIRGLNGGYRPGGKTGLEVFLNTALTWADATPDPTYGNQFGPGVVQNQSLGQPTAVIEVGYDFDGDGLFDRVETYTWKAVTAGLNRYELVGNLTPLTGVIDPNIPDGRPVLDPSLSKLADFQDMTNGSVQVRLWQGTWATAPNDHKEYAVSVNAQRGMARSSRIVIPFDDADSGPQVLLVSPPAATVTSQPVASITARLSQPAVAGAFTAESLRLTRDGQPVTIPDTVTVTQIGTTNDYTITGLTGLNATPGAYVLTVVGSKIQSGGAKPGSGTASAA